MAVLTAPSLADIRATMDPDGKFAKIIEALAPTNEILMDMGFMEGNLPTGHRTTIRTGLPQGTWRKFGQGVASTKGTTAQVDFDCAMLEARIEVDVKLAKLGGNSSEYRASQVEAHTQGLSSQLADTVFYGDRVANPSTDNAKFDGLTYYYKTKTGSTGNNMVNAGAANGQTDCSSMWLICWSSNGIYGITPKGLTVGLDHRDLGEYDAFDGSQNRFRVFGDLLEWNVGLALQDWRDAVRIHSIDISALTSTAANQQALFNYMAMAVHKLPNKSKGRCAFYANSTVLSALDQGARADVKAGGGLTYETVDGRPVTKFRGIPVRQCDALTITETSLN